MTTRSDLETELLERLLVADNSTLYPSARLTMLIQNAYRWAKSLVIWNDLVNARKTGTKVDHEYYDYPAEFRSESIIRLEVDGEVYERKNFEDYLDYKDNNANTTKKMFASFSRRYFINPTPTLAGSYNIHVWGAIEGDQLDSSSSTTIFSYGNEEGNEAIIQKAFAVAIGRADPQLAKSETQEATVTLLRLHQLEQGRTQRNKRLDHPMFNVPDYFGGSQNSTTIGNWGSN